MMNFGRDHVFALDDDGGPDVRRRSTASWPRTAASRSWSSGSPSWCGCTSTSWRARRLDLSQGMLVHSGGWKKLADQAVDNAEFRRRLAPSAGLTRVHNFYGMVEQIGTVFLEGPRAARSTAPTSPTSSIRDPETWEELPPGEPGWSRSSARCPTSLPGPRAARPRTSAWCTASTTAPGRASASPCSAGCPAPRPAAAATPAAAGRPHEGRRQVSRRRRRSSVRRAARERVADGGPARAVGDERVRRVLSRRSPRRLLAPALARRHPELGSLGFFLRPQRARRASTARRGCASEHRPGPARPGLPRPAGQRRHDLRLLVGAVGPGRQPQRRARLAAALGGRGRRDRRRAQRRRWPTPTRWSAATQRIVTYDRDDAITARALSAACDLRVIWGGDRAVDEIRRTRSRRTPATWPSPTGRRSRPSAGRPGCRAPPATSAGGGRRVRQRLLLVRPGRVLVAAYRLTGSGRDRRLRRGPRRLHRLPVARRWPSGAGWSTPRWRSRSGSPRYGLAADGDAVRDRLPRQRAGQRRRWPVLGRRRGGGWARARSRTPGSDRSPSWAGWSSARTRR